MKWTLLSDHPWDLSLKKGDVVYAFKGYDYGSANHDTRELGYKCVSVTAASDGVGLPFITVPLHIMGN